MRHPVLDRVLRRRQGLTEYLATEYLRTADVPAVASKNILLDTLECEQRDQVFEDRVHLTQRIRVNQTSVRPPSTAIPPPLTKTASSLARNNTTLATSTGSPTRRAAEFAMQ